MGKQSWSTSTAFKIKLFSSIIPLILNLVIFSIEDPLKQKGIRKLSTRRLTLSRIVVSRLTICTSESLDGHVDDGVDLRLNVHRIQL